MSDTEPTTMPSTPTDEPTPQQTLKQIWGHIYPQIRDRNLDTLLITDESMIRYVVAAFQGDKDFLGITTRAQASAAIEYWRARTIEGVDQVAARMRAEIAAYHSEPTEGKS